MKNAHERFGILEYTKRMKDTTTRIRLRLDRFIGEVDDARNGKAHLISVLGGDSAGARITEQVQMFPGRRGAGRIFYNEVQLSGLVPQICVLFGPSAAGGAYIPAFCDVVIMRDGNASMYLGSPRMAEMVIGEKVSLEEMGGARMHTSTSGCGHQLVKSDEEGIATARRYLSYLPGNWQQDPPLAAPSPPHAPPDGQSI